MTTLLFLSYEHLLIIALIVLLLFGGKKIPELMHGLGKGVKSFKSGMKDVEEEVKKSVDEVKDETTK
ncbi:Sec-independent protein translocase subunit TatA/TatB [Paludibacter jiangxiensis]|jgi:sec-independent protein translocase protein TatA|uniref:Sec-independent protein translocase protein TatA n=1 Tax=Paludibacter jiangxiensis TaxID=681398 RepID=A0A161M652_9BACT|nr:twin-arginine translocase TatA/TatE family subunit [Paludibacter jiangxiensis]MDP4202676.1 twin-arginine translocase TatA/TatE family subunit [Bacteroidota bacterium]GAT64063.1 sec-independent protein translocase protein TatA [Paludibacter jiangxiensis]